MDVCQMNKQYSTTLEACEITLSKEKALNTTSIKAMNTA